MTELAHRQPHTGPIVWVLSTGEDHEGGEVLGVYATKEIARARSPRPPATSPSISTGRGRTRTAPSTRTAAVTGCPSCRTRSSAASRSPDPSTCPSPPASNSPPTKKTHTMTVTAAEIRAALHADTRLTQHIAHIHISARRRTLGMSIKPGDPGITVHVPATANPTEIAALLGRNRERIGALLVKAERHTPDHFVRALVNGSGFLWLGTSSRLRLVDQPAETVRHVDDYGNTAGRPRWLELDRDAVPQGARPIISWYTREGTAWLNAETPRWWAQMAPHRPIPVVRADDIGRRRWGVYDGARHEIRIAWQAMQFTPRLVRHVLVHELVHATRPPGKPHGPGFWRRFEAATPGARQDKQDLNEAGLRIWMGDTA